MRRSLLALLVWLCASPVAAQVVFDAASSGTTTGTSLTFAHTTTSSADRVIYVCVSIDAGIAFEPTVTYNSVSLTKLTEIETDRYTGLWRLVAPATGSNDVVVSSLPGGGDESAIAMTFSGVDQTTPEDARVTANGASATSVTNDVSSAADDLVADCLHLNNVSNFATAGASQTERVDAETGGGHTYATSTEPGAGTVTMSWSWSSTVAYAQIAWNLNAAAGSPPVSSCGRGTLLGVGC